MKNICNCLLSSSNGAIYSILFIKLLDGNRTRISTILRFIEAEKVAAFEIPKDLLNVNQIATDQQEMSTKRQVELVVWNNNEVRFCIVKKD